MTATAKRCVLSPLGFILVLAPSLANHTCLDTGHNRLASWVGDVGVANREAGTALTLRGKETGWQEARHDRD